MFIKKWETGYVKIWIEKINTDINNRWTDGYNIGKKKEEKKCMTCVRLVATGKI